MSQPNNSAVVVYPGDPSIVLQGDWALVNDSGTALEMADSPASASITFHGVRIGVFGLLEPGPQVSSLYSLDGSSPVPFIGPSNVTDQEDGITFYLSPVLQSGQHQLVWNVTNATADYPYLLEYIIYAHDIDSSGLSTTSATPSGPTSSVVVGDSASAQSTPVGAIVGGVVGGVAGLVIVALVVFFLMRRRGGRPYFYAPSTVADMLHHEVKPSDTSPHPMNSAIPPAFSQTTLTKVGSNIYYGDHGTPKSSEVGASAYLSNNLSQSGLGGSMYVGGPVAPIPMGYAMSAAGSSSDGSSSAGPAASRRAMTVVNSSPNQPNSKAAQAGLLSIAQPATYHADSGIRFGQSGQPSATAGPSGGGGQHDIPSDVPPSYSEN